jgi:FkbM family methyltransferase
MPEATLFQTFTRWISSKKLRKFLSDKNNWKTVVQFRECSFFAGGDNKIEAALMRGQRYYDRDNFTAVDSFVKPGHVCFDIGANIGVYSVIFGKLSGSAKRVHSFEPVEHIRARLQANIRLNGMEAINVNGFALGSEPGLLEMLQIKEGHFRGGTSTFVKNENIAEMGESEFEKRQVEIRTLDQYVIDVGLDRVDFIKIDVEGFELNVLRGAEDTLSQFKPTIILEYDERRHGEHGDSIKELLLRHGYQTYQFTSFDETLVLLPFDFTCQPINRNILCWNTGLGR